VCVSVSWTHIVDIFVFLIVITFPKYHQKKKLMVLRIGAGGCFGKAWHLQLDQLCNSEISFFCELVLFEPKKEEDGWW
jgi:hypothetical protein